MTKPIHNHGAAISGQKSEAMFRDELRNDSFTVLRYSEDFQEYYGKKEGKKIYRDTILVKVPQSWVEDEAIGFDEKSKFIIDGFLPEFDQRLELKYSKSAGTTEEKIFYDLEKIRDGVYDGKKLLYAIFGPLAEEQRIFRLFSKKVLDFDPTEERVKVILDKTPNLSKVKQYLYWQKNLLSLKVS